jgi:fatty-acyl-CoA synthase
MAGNMNDRVTTWGAMMEPVAETGGLEMEQGRIETVAGHLDAAARELPERAALICDGETLDFNEYRNLVTAYSKGMLAYGLEPGGRVALMMDNHVEHPVAFLAAERIGVTSVLVNNRLQADEVGFVLEDSSPGMVIVGERFVSGEEGSALARALRKKVGAGSVFVRGRAPEGSGFRELRELEALSGDVGDADLERAEEGVAGDNRVAVIYTSGTTGRPKGAVLTERNIVFNLTAWRGRLPEEYGPEVVGVFFPLFHSAGMIGGICGAIVNRFTVVLADFDIEGSLRLISEHGVTVMGAVAAMTALQLASPVFDDNDYSSLRYIIMGAGPCPPEILREVRERMGADVIIGYGLTEGTMGNLITTLEDDTEDHKLNTIGVPLPGVEVRLVDEGRREVPDGVVGEIAVRGPTVFEGYLNLPEETAGAVDGEGWLYTGDLAVRDPDGYYRIVGRLSEMYIRGGENVYPREVEDVLKEHPEVLIAAVMGIPDEIMGEEGRAYVIKAPGSELGEDDVREFCAGRLADYKVPREVVFREFLPLTPVGKVQKKILAEEIRCEFGL